MRNGNHNGNQGAKDGLGANQGCFPLPSSPRKARAHLLTSLKRGRGILLTSTGLLSAMLTNLASRIATAQETWTHLPKGKGLLSSPLAPGPVAFQRGPASGTPLPHPSRPLDFQGSADPEEPPHRAGVNRSPPHCPRSAQSHPSHTTHSHSVAQEQSHS